MHLAALPGPRETLLSEQQGAPDPWGALRYVMFGERQFFLAASGGAGMNE